MMWESYQDICQIHEPHKRKTGILLMEAVVQCVAIVYVCIASPAKSEGE